MGDAETYRLTETRRKIALAMETKEKTATDIADELDQPIRNVRRTLTRMYERGEIRQMGKRDKEVLWRSVPH